MNIFGRAWRWLIKPRVLGVTFEPLPAGVLVSKRPLTATEVECIRSEWKKLYGNKYLVWIVNEYDGSYLRWAKPE